MVALGAPLVSTGGPRHSCVSVDSSGVFQASREFLRDVYASSLQLRLGSLEALLLHERVDLVRRERSQVDALELRARVVEDHQVGVVAFDVVDHEAARSAERQGSNSYLGGGERMDVIKLWEKEEEKNADSATHPE